MYIHSSFQRHINEHTKQTGRTVYLTAAPGKCAWLLAGILPAVLAAFSALCFRMVSCTNGYGGASEKSPPVRASASLIRVPLFHSVASVVVN